MKSTVLVFAMLMICITGVAQNLAMNSSGSDANFVRKDDYDDDVPENGSFLVGFRWMPTFSNFDLHNPEGGVLETSFEMGNGFGALVGTNFSNHVGLQAELIYTELAQKYRDNSLDYKVKLRYVNVPLMLVFNTNYSKAVNLNICAGPQVSFNTGSDIEASGVGEGDSVHAVLAVKPADLGFAYGAGLDFGLSSAVKLSVGYRGVIGLIDISDDNENIATDQYYILQRSHMNTYAGYLGLTFGF